MSSVLVNHIWVEIDCDGMTVADLLSELSNDHTVENTNGLTVKADGVVLAPSDTLSDQQTIEVVEIPSNEDAGSTSSVDSSSDVDTSGTSDE